MICKHCRKGSRDTGFFTIRKVTQYFIDKPSRKLVGGKWVPGGVNSTIEKELRGGTFCGLCGGVLVSAQRDLFNKHLT